MSSEKYHSFPNSISSTQLKTVLEDPQLFYDKYISKEVDREHIDAFDVGTYFHTAILEPHLVEKEIVVYEKGYRSGKEWEEFKKKYKNKAILTPAMKASGDKLIKNVNESKASQKYLKKIKPEISLFISLVVFNDTVYAPDFGVRLTPQGWVEMDNLPAFDLGVEITVKVRADILGKYFIADLKSTSGDVMNKEEMAEKISHYDYDLSAALYLDLFSLVKPKVKEFVWIFSSKDKAKAHPWIASPTNILVGRAKWMTAVREYALCVANEWKVPEVRYLEPEAHQLHWLSKVKELDNGY